MDCRILRHITLKSDGHLGCDDSVGYNINLGHVSLYPGWHLRDVINGPIYTHLRTSFKNGKVPWPGVCEGCDLFSSAAQPVDTLNSRIELLVEPTLACNISCACCMRKQIISKGRNIASLDPEILRRFVAACNSETIDIDQVHYIGWGEPLMHGNFRELFDIVKEYAPNANQMVTTAANVDFLSTVGDSSLDRLIVSCDGARQESYSQYRRGGEFAKVVKFMSDSKKYGNSAMYLEWKYILFEFNDSDEEILYAQKLADDIGVDSLLFIITNSKWHSKRFTVDSSSYLPLISLVATVSPAAAMNAIAAECTAFQSFDILNNGFGFIDRCNLSVGKFLTVEGWAFDQSGAYSESLELVVDGNTRAKSRTTLRRLDVVKVHTSTAGAKCGFMFRIPIDVSALPNKVEIRIYGQSGIALIGGLTSWSLPESEIKKRMDFPVIQLASNSQNHELITHPLKFYSEMQQQ